MIYKVGFSVASAIILFRVIPEQGVLNGLFAIAAVLSALILPALFLEYAIKDEKLVAVLIVSLAIGLAFLAGAFPTKSSSDDDDCREYGRYGIEVCR